MTPHTQFLPTTHRAVVLTDFGGADRLRVEAVPSPQRLASDEILVRVYATSVNPIEWKMREGLGLPRAVWRRLLGWPMVLGLDFSGVVEAHGRAVRDFVSGDEVMGALPLHGADAERVVVRPADRRTALAHKPQAVPHAVAALLPFAGLVAYAGLMTEGGLTLSAHGARVLVVGASGGVGHLAVQIAKRCLTADLVVGVCSGKNVEFARRCGADATVAYDETALEVIADLHPDWAGRFDVIFDTIGIDAYWHDVAPRLLKPTGRFVTAALPPTTPGRVGEDVGPWQAGSLLTRLVARRLHGYRVVTGLLGGLPSKDGFSHLVRWLGEGRVTPRLAASYPLERLADAHRASETGRTVGKIGINVSA